MPHNGHWTDRSPASRGKKGGVPHSWPTARTAARSRQRSEDKGKGNTDTLHEAPPGCCLSGKHTSTEQLRGIYEMRKSLVLAMVLVLAIAGSSLAANAPTISGNLKLEAKSATSFTGPFALTPSLRVDADFAESGDNWQFDARVRSTWSGSGNVVVGINRYRGILTAGNWTYTVARNYSLGNIDTPFNWIRQASNPGSTVDQLRAVGKLNNVDVHAQLVSNDNFLRLRAQAPVNAWTLGTGVEYKLGDTANSNYTVYGIGAFGVVSVKAIYGSFAGNGHYAVDVEGKASDALTLGATYSDYTYKDTTQGYALRATFEQNLVRATASYKEHEKNTSLWFKYRGSADNQAFGDLFEGDPWKSDPWTETWYKNVAPAFGLNYSTKEGTDATIKLFGVAPFAGKAIGRAEVATQAGNTGFLVEARFSLSDKVVLNPFADKATNAPDTTIGARLFYTVSSNSEIHVEAKQTGPAQSLLASYSINF